MRRLIERENKKERDTAKRAFNDLMRVRLDRSRFPSKTYLLLQKFVEFIRKKDQRLAAFLKAERLRRKEQEDARAAVRAQQKEAHAQNRELYDRESAAMLDSIEFHEDDHERLGIKSKPKKTPTKKALAEDGSPIDDAAAEESDEDDDDVEEQHYCFACRKKFKSDKQYENHEKSKKHKENVAILKAEVMLDEEIEQYLQDQQELDEQLHQMESEDAQEPAETVPAADADAEEDSASLNDPAMLELLEKLKVSKAPAAEPVLTPQAAATAPAVAESSPISMKPPADRVSVESDDEDGGDDEDFFLQSMLAKTQSKSKKQQKQAKKASARNAFTLLMDDVADYEAHVEAQQKSQESDDDEGDSKETSMQSSSSSTSTTALVPPAAASAAPAAAGDSGKKQQPKKRRRKAKGEPATAGAANVGGSATPDNAPSTADASSASDLKCRVCKKAFPSRNDLFQHLKDSKHAQAK